MWKRFFLLIVAVGLCLAMVGPAAAEYLVGLTHGTNKHRPEFSFEPADTYHLFAAQNEWEPFQVLVRDDAGVTDVDVDISPFSGPGDDITEVEAYRVHYLEVTADRISHQPPDPNSAGYWPDALVPFVDHFVGEIRAGAPFDVAADFAQAVFVDVFVPEDQTPGDYTATVTVTATDRATWTGTVTLTVWDFALPDQLSIDSNYGYSRSTPCSWHGNNGGTTDCDTLNLYYYEEFARHRMGIYSWRMTSPTATWNDATNTFDWDWTEFDTLHAPYLDGGFYRDYAFTGMRLPGPQGGRPGHVTPADWEREYWKGWGDHFEAMGWIDKIWYYMPDEPDPAQYPSLRDLSQRIHNAHPGLQPMVTEQYEEDLDGDIDIWCPDEPLFSDSMPWPPYPEKYDEVRDAGMKTWWYNCVSATTGFGYASHMIDQESTHMRAWLWLTRRYHFQGILFWHTLYNYRGGQDLWSDNFAYQFVCQGDGTMIYPGVVSKIGGSSDIPVASLRMKYLREGMEDYEYFHLLDLAGYEDWVDGVTLTVAPKTWQFERDWERVLDWRRKVAEKILGELDEIPPAAPTDVDGTPDIEAVELTWTAPTAPDLAGYEIWYVIYEGDELFGGMVDANATGARLLGLMPGRDHVIWVQAFDLNGNRSAPSEEITVRTLAEGDDDNGDDDDQHNRNGVSAEGITAGDDDGGGNAAGDDDDDGDQNAGCGGI